MNRSALKTYAPKARREFIQAVTDRAAFYGLTKDETLPVTLKGDVAIIGGRAFPSPVAEKRAKLEDRIERLGSGGFERTMEAVAYTWFNRLVAIRYMELHGYLDHGYRVLSHPEGKPTPEIVEHAEHVVLPGLDSQRVIELKLDGTKESELFRMLLLAQCNALHSAMPFLFERIDDETELLLPENLLHSDSIVRKLVSEIDEADWQEVEIIGWLYQFYISEKKDEVIGKVVKSEDIPAATQLFTPNWIVKYLVQNSLGRQWLATYPESTLKGKWEYYIEPAEQTPEVQAKLREITPTSLNPEDLTIMDPACGSGHILVEAYELLKDIYLERGYRLRDIPRLILTKNVYGLEIDDRAAQLACFALLMKARADDRKIFDPPPQLNVLAIQETNGLDISAIVQAFTDRRITKHDGLRSRELDSGAAERAPLFANDARATPAKADEQVAADLRALLTLFENAKIYGSLLTVPPRLEARLPKIAAAVEAAKADPNLAVQNAARIAGGFVMAATVLARRYDAVAANPPYMGLKGQNDIVKEFAQAHFPNSKADLFGMFIERACAMRVSGGFCALVTMQSWMFLGSYLHLRASMLDLNALPCLLHMDNGVMGIAFGTTAFVCRQVPLPSYRTSFVYCYMSDIGDDGYPHVFPMNNARRVDLSVAELAAVPERPLVYWMSEQVRGAFRSGVQLREIADPKVGLQSGDNERFVRRWAEVDVRGIGFGMATGADAAKSGLKWFPYNKGGEYRRWYGNQDWVVNWQEDGKEIRSLRPNSVVRNSDFYFLPNASWAKVTSGRFVLRYFGSGFVFDMAGCSLFESQAGSLAVVTALLNSNVTDAILTCLAPTVNFEVGQVGRVPLQANWRVHVAHSESTMRQCVRLAQEDWDCTERSWSFGRHPWLKMQTQTAREDCDSWSREQAGRRDAMRQLEGVNNRYWIAAYGLEREIDSGVPEEQLTVRRSDRTKESESLCSYVLGCSMGRYSLDKLGLIYANSGNAGFDPSQYKTFPADPDGIIPITEHDWFPDSAARRFEEFVGVAWPKGHLEENLQFVADSLTGKSVSDPRETIRSYFANDFYKHHLQTYKKRPIYWLFCSGKQRAFQALVYLHRYHEGTLARMRTEYVIPLQGKIASRIAQLEGDISKATSSAHSKKLTKEKDALEKQRVELLAFDEKLRHYADQRIKLDLDDGVKVNYGKFGDLLAEVKAICGEKEED